MIADSAASSGIPEATTFACGMVLTAAVPGVANRQELIDLAEMESVETKP